MNGDGAPPDELDRPDAAQLRARGSLKWTGVEADVAAWVAESDLGTAPAVTSALHTAVDDGALGYLPPAARRAMAGACARWYADRYGWTVPDDRVMPVGDVREALRIAVDLCSRPGSPLIVPTPTYMPFLTAPSAWGREVLQVPMTTDAEGRTTPDLDALDRAFDAGGHLLVLINPHNPTGRVLRREELLGVAEVVARRGGRVFADEIHAPLVHSGHEHVPYASLTPETAAHTMTATSASKAWNIPGLKCAQVLLSADDDVARWREHDTLLTEGASTLGALANAAAYDDGRAWLGGVLGYLEGNRSVFADVLTRLAPTVRHRSAEGTYLAWVDVREALDRLGDACPPWRTAPPGALAQWVLDRSGVATTDGAACGEAGRGHVRLTLAMPRPLVVVAAERLAACLRP